MRVTTTVPADLGMIPGRVQYAEALGYDTLSAEEVSNDPFARLAIAAEHSERAQLMTSVAVAFARSPYVIAHQAWALQRFSGGRFVLGLGTQVKGHIERRFSMPWASPGPKLRDFVLAVRAIWDTWQHGTRPSFEGEHYRFTLMNPASSPGPIEHPDIPVVLAAVNRYNARLAGRVGDGLVIHAFTTRRYTEEVLIPALLDGARAAGRNPSSLHISGGGFIATGRDERAVELAREQARSRIAYYGSTRTYSEVLALHGWAGTAAELHRLSLEGKWDAMTALVTDEMVDEFVVSGTWEQLPAQAAKRYGGLVTHIGFGATPAEPDEEAAISETIDALQAIAPFAPE